MCAWMTKPSAPSHAHNNSCVPSQACGSTRSAQAEGSDCVHRVQRGLTAIAAPAVAVAEERDGTCVGNIKVPL